jgi:hypothetical protein
LLILPPHLRCGVTPPADSTTFGVSGDQFTINGTPTFLLGVSYFQALDWKQSDIEGLASRGYNCIRIFLEHWVSQDLAALKSSGSFTEYAAIIDLCRACSALGIVVEVVILDWESNPVSSDPTTACANVATALLNEPNVFFDVVNEHNLGTYTNHTTLAGLASTVRSNRPGSICASSSSAGHSFTDNPSDAIVSAGIDSDVLTVGADFFAPHLPRGSSWYSNTGERVTALKNYLVSISQDIPLYLSEENRRNGSWGQPTQANFEQAVSEAITAGAAGWIFHTNAAFDLSGSNTFFGQLDSVEADTVDSLPSLL